MIVNEWKSLLFRLGLKSVSKFVQTGGKWQKDVKIAARWCILVKMLSVRAVNI